MMTPEEMVKTRLFQSIAPFCLSVPPNRLLFELCRAANEYKKDEGEMEFNPYQDALMWAFKWSKTPQPRLWSLIYDEVCNNKHNLKRDVPMEACYTPEQIEEALRPIA